MPWKHLFWKPQRKLRMKFRRLAGMVSFICFFVYNSRQIYYLREQTSSSWSMIVLTTYMDTPPNEMEGEKCYPIRDYVRCAHWNVNIARVWQEKVNLSVITSDKRRPNGSEFIFMAPQSSMISRHYQSMLNFVKSWHKKLAIMILTPLMYVIMELMTNGSLVGRNGNWSLLVRWKAY